MLVCEDVSKYFAGSKSANWARRTSFNAEFLIDSQVLVNFYKLRGGADLNRLHLMRSLRLNSVRGHHCLEAHRLGNQNDLHN